MPGDAGMGAREGPKICRLAAGGRWIRTCGPAQKTSISSHGTGAAAGVQTIAGLREYARFAAPEVLELYVTGLRVAGLPEK